MHAAVDNKVDFFMPSVILYAHTQFQKSQEGRVK